MMRLHGEATVTRRLDTARICPGISTIVSFSVDDTSSTDNRSVIIVTLHISTC